MGYKEDITIDKMRLDWEWERHPSLIIKWYEKHAESIYKRDKKKEQLDVISANVEKEVRLDPDKFKIDKLTESAVRSAVVTDQRVREASEDFIQAKKEEMILAGVKEAFNHRKYALENVVKLFLANYYAEPYVTKEDREGYESVRVQKGLENNKRLRRLKEEGRKERE